MAWFKGAFSWFSPRYTFFQDIGEGSVPFANSKYRFPSPGSAPHPEVSVNFPRKTEELAKINYFMTQAPFLGKSLSKKPRGKNLNVSIPPGIYTDRLQHRIRALSRPPSDEEMTDGEN